MRLRVVVDSDGIIKITKAGLLEIVVEAWECLIPRAVYAETVDRGLRMAYPDASEIQASIHPAMIRSPRHHARATAILRKTQGLGPGEREALHLYFSSRADTILTDDAAFLDVLLHAEIPAMPPALAIVSLQEQGALGHRDALAGLERLRPHIRPDVYRAARADLELNRPAAPRPSQEGIR